MISFGLLQPLAHGLKLILKEPLSPSSANFSLFSMAPVATFNRLLLLEIEFNGRYLLPEEIMNAIWEWSLLMDIILFVIGFSW